MMNKMPLKYRKPLFALVMSASTGLIVSGVIISLHGVVGAAFIQAWLHAFLTAWPIVFVAILVIAPRVDRLLDVFVNGDKEAGRGKI
jgi:hypothetical protein